MQENSGISKNTAYGTGRIGEIIDSIEARHNKPVDEISAETLLTELCNAMQITPAVLDDLIANNSPVLRTVKGHAFETFFDLLLESINVKSTVIGGDDEVDRVVNGHKLQLKTPTESGSRGDLVQYKTHKTHGAKSERESLDYYSTEDSFADILVGLVSYKPLKIIFLDKADLPRHAKSHKHLQSPFTVNILNNPILNDFERIGIRLEEELVADDFDLSVQLLPQTSAVIGVSSEVIIRTILSRSNFRIWDMSVRGFIRERIFNDALDGSSVSHVDPLSTGRARADKADVVLRIPGKGDIFIQMKGISTNNCNFNFEDPEIATETQLTRGRVNDHPTQSRLYLNSDFDFLVLAVDPPVAQICGSKSRVEPGLDWEFYAIPTEVLRNHAAMPHRLNAVQKFRYSKLQEFRVRDWKNHF